MSIQWGPAGREQGGVSWGQEEERDKLKGTNGAKFAVFRAFPGNFKAFQGRRFSQQTADFRRKRQETADFCRNPFVPFSLSLLIPPCGGGVRGLLCCPDGGGGWGHGLESRLEQDCLFDFG